MVADNVSTFTSSNAAIDAVTTSNAITAAHFAKMLDIVDTLNSHGHTFTDDYSTNCDCQCQRGSL